MTSLPGVPTMVALWPKQVGGGFCAGLPPARKASIGTTRTTIRRMRLTR
jgi:hypothetical protein